MIFLDSPETDRPILSVPVRFIPEDAVLVDDALELLLYRPPANPGTPHVFSHSQVLLVTRRFFRRCRALAKRE